MGFDIEELVLFFFSNANRSSLAVTLALVCASDAPIPMPDHVAVLFPPLSLVSFVVA